MISGTRSSWYREPESALSLCAGNEIGAPNLSNIESFGFLLTDHARFHPVWKSPKTTRTTVTAVLNQTSIVGKMTLSLDRVGGRERQRLRVIVIDADRKGENENCWLHWSKQRAKKGLTRQLEVIGLTPGAPRREALEVAIADDDVVSDEPPRFAVRTLSALLVSDVPLTPFHPSPSNARVVRSRYGSFWKRRWIFRPRSPPSLRPHSPRASRPDRPRKRQGARQARSADSVRAASARAWCSRMLRAAVSSPWKPRRDGHAARADDRAHCRNHECRPVTACDRKSAFAQRPGDSEARRRRIEDRAVESAAKTQRFIARLPIDVTPELRGRIKVVAFQRGQMVTEMPRDPRAREFPQRQGAWFDGRSHRG